MKWFVVFYTGFVTIFSADKDYDNKWNYDLRLFSDGRETQVSITLSEPLPMSTPGTRFFTENTQLSCTDGVYGLYTNEYGTDFGYGARMCEAVSLEWGGIRFDHFSRFPQ